MSEIAIRCPRCQAEASFESGFLHLDGAEAKQARKNPSLVGVENDGGYTVVRYPKILSWKHQSNRSYNQKAGVAWGICKCPKCGYLNKHKLNWNEDAYYRIEVIGKVLWGWNRQKISDLREYISAKDRNHWQNWYFIRHVPKEFKSAKHRDEVVKKLEKLLKEK